MQTLGGTQKPPNLMEELAKKERRAMDPGGLKKEGKVEEEAGKEEGREEEGGEEEEVTSETLRGKPRPLPISALPAFSYIPPRHQGPKERSYFSREGQVSRSNKQSRGGVGMGLREGGGDRTIREGPEGRKGPDKGGTSVLGRGLGRGHNTGAVQTMIGQDFRRGSKTVTRGLGRTECFG